MLLARHTVKDSKTGKSFDMALVKVVVDGNWSEEYVPYGRWKHINDCLRAQAHAWDVEMLKRVTDSSDPIAFYVSQLAYTEAKMYARQRVPPIWKELVPVSYEAPPWAETVEYQTYDETGIGKRISPNGQDIPLVDAKFGRKQIQVESGGLGYSYNMQLLIASQQLKRPLSDIRMTASMNGYNRHMNIVALWGEMNFSGLFNNSAITPVAATTGAWDTAGTDPAAILRDINTGIKAVYQNSGTNAVVDTIALPIDALSALNDRILTVTTSGGTTNVPAGGMSLLKYLKENNISKLTRGVDINFVGIPADPSSGGHDLNSIGTIAHNGSGSTGKSRVVYYAKQEDFVRMHIPQPLQFLAPQLERLAVVVPAHYRYAGTEITYPKTVYYQDSVLAADVA